MHKSSPRIIGVCGKIGSGKSTFVNELLLRIPNSERIGTGDVLKNKLLPKDSVLDRSELFRLVAQNRNRLGPDFVKNAIRTKIEGSDADFIIIDGVRGPNVKSLMDEYPNSVLVAIMTNSEKRYDRVRTRDEKVDEIGIERGDFETNDKRDHATAIDSLELVADVQIENDGTYEEFLSKIDKFTNTLTK